jgi:hypothetical protein
MTLKAMRRDIGTGQRTRIEGRQIPKPVAIAAFS